MAVNSKPGKKAPDFQIKDTEGNDVRLSDFQGSKNVLVLFFPLAFTGVCSKEMCYMRDDLTFYSDLNVEVLGISVDSFFTLKEFKNARELNFTLLSDFNREVSAAYDALHEDFFGMNGVSKRAAFLVDTEGIIRYSEILDNPSDMPDFDSVKEVVTRLTVAAEK
ncbi:MAG: peroxiredoxin [Balneolaceae bacterium]|nr:MAG: peroxiredoxin [Balneolaceae bacterium]